MRMSFPWGGQESKVSCTEQKSSLALLPNPRSPCLSQSDQQPDSRGFTQSLLQAWLEFSSISTNRPFAVVALAPPFLLPGKSCAELAAALPWPAELLTSLSTSPKETWRIFPVYVLCRHAHSNSVSQMKFPKKSGNTSVWITNHNTHNMNAYMYTHKPLYGFLIIIQN